MPARQLPTSCEFCIRTESDRLIFPTSNVRNFRDRFTVDFLEECESLSHLMSTCAKNGYVFDLQDLLYRCTMVSHFPAAQRK